MFKKGAILAAAILTASVGVSKADARDYISIVGSSTVYPFATVVAEQFGFQTQYSKMDIFGLCPKCRKKEEDEFQNASSRFMEKPNLTRTGIINRIQMKKPVKSRFNARLSMAIVTTGPPMP